MRSRTHHRQNESAGRFSPHARRDGFSLLEIVISTLLVGLVMIGALRSMTASMRSSESLENTTQAVLLADELMAEILRQDYAATADSGVLNGGAGGFASDSFLGGGQTTTGNGPTTISGNRSTFQNVDQYDNWTASPPEEKDGTQRTELVNWRRRVTVDLVDPDDLTSVISSDLGVKRITVTVESNGDIVTELQAVQTRAWINMIPEPGHNRTTGSQPGA